MKRIATIAGDVAAMVAVVWWSVLMTRGVSDEAVSALAAVLTLIVVLTFPLWIVPEL